MVAPGLAVSERAGRYLRSRSAVGRQLADFAVELRKRRVPNHRSSMFGVVTLACIVVIIVTGRIVRMPGSEYVEVHQQVDPHERWRLANSSDYEPFSARPDERGRIRWSARLRARASQFVFEDRLTPLIRSELERAQSVAPDGRTPG
ncbi:MAG TPA: hypothetical protein VIJ18_11775 [Microbacteriaceae bacterium]